MKNDLYTTKNNARIAVLTAQETLRPVDPDPVYTAHVAAVYRDIMEVWSETIPDDCVYVDPVSGKDYSDEVDELEELR